MSFGNYLENKILDHIFGCGTRNYTSPTNIYVALSTADPTDDGLRWGDGLDIKVR